MVLYRQTRFNMVQYISIYVIISLSSWAATAITPNFPIADISKLRLSNLWSKRFELMLADKGHTAPCLDCAAPCCKHGSHWRGVAWCVFSGLFDAFRLPDFHHGSRGSRGIWDDGWSGSGSRKLWCYAATHFGQPFELDKPSWGERTFFMPLSQNMCAHWMQWWNKFQECSVILPALEAVGWSLWEACKISCTGVYLQTAHGTAWRWQNCLPKTNFLACHNKDHLTGDQSRKQSEGSISLTIGTPKTMKKYIYISYSQLLGGGLGGYIVDPKTVV